MTTSNPCGIRGVAFTEFAAHDPAGLQTIFRDFGFSTVARHPEMKATLHTQHQIQFVLSHDEQSYGWRFAKLHGPSICGLGLAVDDPAAAFAEAVRRGARPFVANAETGRSCVNAPAIYGIGDALLYFVPNEANNVSRDYVPLDKPEIVPDRGFLAIDHLTNNVPRGGLETWSAFYKNIFGFTEVRTFDIRGSKTGLYSFALRSPDGSFCIPINEGTDTKSQIEEYLRAYNGPGIQHLAFLTNDLIASLDAMKGCSVKFLDIDNDYYETVFDRVPNVREDHSRIQGHQILVDGDDEGYLLQIFTKNLVGPIFIELIQRANHLSFGEGNFGALFRSIERDQERRGVI